MSREEMIARLEHLYDQMQTMTGQLTPEEQRELVAMFQEEDKAAGVTVPMSLSESIRAARVSALEVAHALPDTDLAEFVEALEANLQQLHP